MQEHQREHNYDLLRSIAMIAIVVLHVSAKWVSHYIQLADMGAMDRSNVVIVSYVYNAVARFAVPCFVMLSGAFLLDDSRTRDYLDFYRRSFRKIGIPTLIFTVLYVLYRIPSCLMGDNSGLSEVYLLVKDVIRGEPYYHMWYMATLVVIYLMAPIVVRFKDSVSEKVFRIAAYLFLIWAGISFNTSEHLLNWDVGYGIEYLGYFMVGYVIRKDARNTAPKIKWGGQHLYLRCYVNCLQHSCSMGMI